MNVSSWRQRAKHPDADLILLNVLSNKCSSGAASCQPVVTGGTRLYSAVASVYPRANTYLDKTYLISHEQDELTPETLEQADAWLARRKNGEPLAYILGYKEFYGRDFRVTPDVLIPRPETETMIDMVKKLDPHDIVEVGTGSGCIALTLALELPHARIEAVDIFEPALAVAERNQAALGVDSERLTFHKSDLLADVSTPVADVVVANLPYVDHDWDWLNQVTLGFEPDLALYADEQGLALVNKLIVQFAEMNLARFLILEADPSQHAKIIAFAEKQGLKHQQTDGFILQFILD